VESLVARLPGRVLAASVMQQPGRDLCEFGVRRLELALDRKLVLALVQTTPSGPQIAERQRREFVAAELHLDVDELVDGVPDVGHVVVVGRFVGPERPRRESVQRGHRRHRCGPGSGGDLEGTAGDDLLRPGAPSQALRDAPGGPDDAWRRFFVALIGKVDRGGHRLARLGSERRRKGPWRQSSAQSQFPKAQEVPGAAAPKQSDYLPHAIPLHRVSARPRSFLFGLGHQDPLILQPASHPCDRPGEREDLAALLRHLLGKAGEIDFVCRRAG